MKHLRYLSYITRHKQMAIEEKRLIVNTIYPIGEPGDAKMWLIWCEECGRTLGAMEEMFQGETLEAKCHDFCYGLAFDHQQGTGHTHFVLGARISIDAGKTPMPFGLT
jgi:hypothetical protein